MAHLVQAGDARPKKRSAGAVFLFGGLTGGVYTVWWWYRTTRDLEAFEGTGGRDAKAAPVIDVMLALAAWGTMTYLQFTSNSSGSAPGAVDPATGAPPAAAGPGGTFIALLVASFVVYVVLAVRLRRNITRSASLAGMLPEERQGTVMWVLCACLGPVIASTAAQESLNSLWGRYPRWFSSIGGTREDVESATHAAGGATQAASVLPGGGVATAADGPSASDAVRRMQELHDRVASGTISAQEAYDYARAVEEVHGCEQAAPWYAFTFNVDPANRAAAFWHGCYLLDRQGEPGIAVLHRVLGDPAYDHHARGRIVAWLVANGRQTEAAAYGPATSAA